MAFVTKTWKDRLVEYAGRRKLKNVATGEEVLMDVSRSEGTVSQAGDAFSAANMNNLEQRIKNEFDTVNSSLNWKILSSKIGSVDIDLPSIFSELHVVVNVGNTSVSDTWCKVAFNLIYDELTNQSIPYTAGSYRIQEDNVSVVVQANKSAIKLVRATTENGIRDRLTISTTTVYYR